MSQLFWVVVAAAAAAIGALIWWNASFWARRRQRWEQAAGMLGLTLVEGPPLHERFPALHYFQQGTSRSTAVLLEGEGWQGRVVLGDHVYSTGPAKRRRVYSPGTKQHRTQHRHTVCVVTSPSLALPHFRLRREIPLIDRLAELFGGQDIDFEEDQEFSRAFRLRGADEAAVRALFSVAVRHFLLHRAPPGVEVEGRDNVLLVQRGKLLPPENSAPLLQTTQELAQLLRAE